MDAVCLQNAPGLQDRSLEKARYLKTKTCRHRGKDTLKSQRSWGVGEEPLQGDVQDLYSIPDRQEPTGHRLVTRCQEMAMADTTYATEEKPKSTVRVHNCRVCEQDYV